MEIDNVEIYAVEFDGVKQEGSLKYIDIAWSGNIGFGHIYLYTDSSGKLKLATEHMNKEFVKMVLEKLVDEAETVE